MDEAIDRERRDALEAGVHDYVHDYNNERIKPGLEGLSPVAYRLRSTT
jgi:putative transposase